MLDAALLKKIKIAKSGHFCRISLNYPERRNAIGPQMTNELLHAFADANADGDVRVVILEGEGKSFCAGGDFQQMTSGGDGPALEFKGDYADLLLAMVKSEKPIVCKVHGHAMGGGLGLVAASTLAVAAEDAQIGTPEIDVGLFPMMIMAVLSRLVPRRKLLELMLLGQKIPAPHAASLGLLNSTCAPESLEEVVLALAGSLEKKAPKTIALGLRAFALQDDMDLEKALPMLREKLGEVLATNDAREGLMAFLQKRAPVWTGT